MRLRPEEPPDEDAMRCLTLTNPWAGLMAAGIKLVENRTRPMIKRDYIGKRFALQAGAKIDENVYQRIVEIAPELEADLGNMNVPWYRMSRITGAIIAVATLDAILDPLAHGILPGTDEARAGLPEDQRRWFFQEIGYVTRDVVALPYPVKCSGFQAFYRLAPDIEERVRAQLPGGGR